MKRALLGFGVVALASAALVPSAAQTKDGAPPERAVPVATVRASKKDVIVKVDGLGTVTSLATVTVKTQVDGRLDRVAFQEGTIVKKGDLLAQIDPRPFEVQLAQGTAANARDEANLKNAKLNLERFTELRKGNLVSTQQVTDQEALVAQLEAAVMADKAQISSARLNLDYAHITSPINGRTGIRLVDRGNILHPSDTGGIVIVTQLEPIAVIFTLAQDELPRVQKAMSEGKPLVEAYARAGIDRLAEGALESLDNQVNAQTATIRLKAIMPNGDRRLWPNMFVKARLHVATLKDAIVVPPAAIQRGPQGAFVYVIEGKSAQNRPIEVASIEGEDAIIRKGLAPGDVVVTEGQNLLRPGAKVSIAAPADGGAPR
jgi:multidrug efflux system membrane fusion protein